MRCSACAPCVPCVAQDITLSKAGSPYYLTSTIGGTCVDKVCVHGYGAGPHMVHSHTVHLPLAVHC